MKPVCKIKGNIFGFDSDGGNSMDVSSVIFPDGEVSNSSDDENLPLLMYGETNFMSLKVKKAVIAALKKGNIYLAISANVCGGSESRFLLSEKEEQELLDLIPRDNRSPMYGGITYWNKKLTRQYWREQQA